MRDTFIVERQVASISIKICLTCIGRVECVEVDGSCCSASLRSLPLGELRIVDSWRYQASLKQAKARLDSGSTYEARRLLAESAARWPGDGEVEFLLGACEQALGRPDAAAGAWSRVPTNSPFAGHAAMLRVRLLMKRNRFAAAEELLPVALRASGQHAIEARETLVVLFKLEGRFAEVRSLVQEGWDSYPDRFGLLRQLASLDSTTRYLSRRSGPLWRKLPRSLPMTTGSGLVARTSPSVPASSSKPGAGLTTACSGARVTPQSGEAGWTWPLPRAMWRGRGKLSAIYHPTTSRRRRSSPYAPGSPRDRAIRSASDRRSTNSSRGYLAVSRLWSGWRSSNC